MRAGLAMVWLLPVLVGCLDAPPAAQVGALDGAVIDASPADCSSSKLFDEDFAGNELDVGVWDTSKTNPGGIISVADMLVLGASPASGDGYQFTAIHGRASFAVEGTALVAEFSAEVTGDGDAFFGWWNPNDDAYAGVFVEKFGESELVGGAVGTLATSNRTKVCGASCASYDPTTMNMWRVRGTQGQVLFEASTDGETWVPISPASDSPGAEARIIIWTECDELNEVELIAERVTITPCDLP